MIQFEDSEFQFLGTDLWGQMGNQQSVFPTSLSETARATV
jgi:hypothetical protein